MMTKYADGLVPNDVLLLFHPDWFGSKRCIVNEVWHNLDGGYVRVDFDHAESVVWEATKDITDRYGGRIITYGL